MFYFVVYSYTKLVNKGMEKAELIIKVTADISASHSLLFTICCVRLS